VLAAWLQFLFCSAAIAIAGYSLARYGDVIAEKTGLGGTWIGVILVATVTSLPELATGLSSVTVANAPDIAVGDVLGSCVFNLALIAVLDFLYRETPIYQKAGQVHILSAGFSVILIGIVVFSLLSGDAATLRLGHIGIYTPAILALYFVSVRAIFVQERRNAQTREATNRHANLSLTDAVVRYAMAAVIVVAAGIAMPFAAVRLANAMGWGQSFVGTLLVAAATSLPEAASTVGALRIRAIDLAIGNLLCDPRRVPIPSDTQFVVARLVLEFHAEMYWPGIVEIGTRIDRIGRSSVILSQALFVGDACVATSESLVVLIDSTTRRSTSLPAETVAALEAIIDSNAHVPWHAAIPRSSVSKPVMLNAREESSDVAPGQTPARPLHREPSCNADRSISR
jgi:cation:H+ antiporter